MGFGPDATTIDDAYVDGVSLTHGSPQQHIWTFAALRTATLNSVFVMLPQIFPSHHLWVETLL